MSGPRIKKWADIVLVNKSSLEFLGDGDQYYALLETQGSVSYGLHGIGVI